MDWNRYPLQPWELVNADRLILNRAAAMAAASYQIADTMDAQEFLRRELNGILVTDQVRLDIELGL